eukprot:s5234_g4.t1
MASKESTIVAREYTWLQPDRESLFSPATSNIASRILPICFLSLREHQDAVMVSIAVKDAFLTVKQEVPTHVSCTDAAGSTVSYSLGRVLPGQRDGSLLWYKDLAKFVRECSLEMMEFKSYPSILKSKLGECFLMIHVDDLLVVGARKAVMEELIPALKSKYSVSVETMSKGGDEDLVSERLLIVRSVLGTLNPADVGTKRLSASRLQSLSFLLGLYSISSGTLVGSNDPGGIFQQSPARQQQIRLRLSALGLATMTQLQGCSDNMTVDHFTSSSFRAMEIVAADGQFEVKFLITWLLMLVGYGVYMSWTLGGSKTSFAHHDGHAEDFEAAAGMTECSTSSEAPEAEPEWEPPAFSPEGLLHWLYQRCAGREERAAMSRNPTRLEKYRQLKICLRDMLNFLHHATPVEYQRAHEMLHMIGDLSEDEASPTAQENEGIDLSAAAATTAAAGMAMAMSGCDGDGEVQGKPMVSFQTSVLMGWTMLCCLYTWWMLRAGTWQKGPMAPQPLPTTVRIPEGPPIKEVPMPQAEGWVTLTTIRILGRPFSAQKGERVLLRAFAAAMAEEFAKFKRFEYRNLLAISEPESLRGRVYQKMGDLVQYEKPKEIEEFKEKKKKRLEDHMDSKQFCTPAATHMDTSCNVDTSCRQEKRKEEDVVSKKARMDINKGETVLSTDVTEMQIYRPRTAQTKAVYEMLLNRLQQPLGDQAHRKRGKQ